MYLDFYNLHTLPFENTPDPRFFYDSEQHCEALAAIEYTIRMRKGFVLVTGNIGSGKTTVGRKMADRLGDEGTLLMIGHGHRDRDGLLKQILRGMKTKFRSSDDHARLLERVQNAALMLLDEGRPAVLFIDEAQTLSDEILEELRLLSNFDTATQKPIQVILVGQPELRTRIAQPEHLALRQRIAMAKRLVPFSPEETDAYITHRLKAASRDPQNIAITFTPEAVATLHSLCGGVPRLINVACDNCLLMAFVQEKKTVSPEMMARVIDDMIPSFESAPEIKSGTNPHPGNHAPASYAPGNHPNENLIHPPVSITLTPPSGDSVTEPYKIAGSL